MLREKSFACHLDIVAESIKLQEVIMKFNATKLYIVIALATLLPLLSACVITLVEQPSSVTAGETITVTIEYHTLYKDVNPHYGIFGMLIPNDWVVVSVKYDGELGDGECMFLHPDSSDWEPGVQDFWTDSLEFHFPSGPAMQWVVYQSEEAYTVEFDTSFVDGTIELIVGQKDSTYNLGYFVSSSASEIQDPNGIIWYGISLDNPVTVSGGTDIEPVRAIPHVYELEQNYPNPFNPVTSIQFTLPTAEHTTLTVYNVLGEEVSKLVDGALEAGHHRVAFDAGHLKSGVYYYKLESGAHSSIRKMALVK